MNIKRSKWYLLAAIGVFSFLGILLWPPAPESHAETQATFVVVASYWKYEAYVGSTYSPHVHVAAELKNTSTQYFKNVAVRFILRDFAGGEIAALTSAPLKVALAPNESTFISDIIYNSSAYLTDSVEIVPFGDVAIASDYSYLPDPQPLYLDNVIDGGKITYYGEIVNNSSKTWKTECDDCDALNLTAVYYEGSRIVAYQSSILAPDGHLRPGDRSVFVAQFDRVPNSTLKLFSKVLPMNLGDYATVWQIENLSWSLVDGMWGWKEIMASVRLRNLSDVPAKPDVWFVARDTDSKWMGWSFCWSFSDIQPGAVYECTENISRGDMHVGQPEDAKSVDVLYASSAITHQEQPNTSTPTATSTATLTSTWTPTATSTSTATLTSAPTMTQTAAPTATPTATQTATATATVTATPTNVPTLAPTPTATTALRHSYLPLMLRFQLVQ